MSTGCILFSGGLDSSLALIKLLEQGHTVYPIWMKYNQWQEIQEGRHVREVLKYMPAAKPLIELDVKFTEKVGHSSSRFIAFMGLAGMIGDIMNLGFEFIATGYLGLPDYPESRDPVQQGMTDILGELGLGHKNILYGMTKEDVGKELSKYDIPWEVFFTCYWNPPCSWKSDSDKYLCGGCRNKVKAMEAAGITNFSRRPNISY